MPEPVKPLKPGRLLELPKFKLNGVAHDWAGRPTLFSGINDYTALWLDEPIVAPGRLIRAPKVLSGGSFPTLEDALSKKNVLVTGDFLPYSGIAYLPPESFVGGDIYWIDSLGGYTTEYEIYNEPIEINVWDLDTDTDTFFITDTAYYFGPGNNWYSYTPEGNYPPWGPPPFYGPGYRYAKSATATAAFTEDMNRIAAALARFNRSRYIVSYMNQTTDIIVAVPPALGEIWFDSGPWGGGSYMAYLNAVNNPPEGKVTIYHGDAGRFSDEESTFLGGFVTYANLEKIADTASFYADLLSLSQQFAVAMPDGGVLEGDSIDLENDIINFFGLELGE